MKIVDRMPHVTAWPYEENFARQLPKEPYALRICSSWRPNASSLLLLSGRPSKDQGPRRRFLYLVLGVTFLSGLIVTPITKSENQSLERR